MADTHLATVGDLIDHLSRFPRDLPVFMDFEEWDQDTMDVTRVGLSHQCRVEQRSVEDWREVDEGGFEALIVSHYSP